VYTVEQVLITTLLPLGYPIDDGAYLARGTPSGGIYVIQPIQDVKIHLTLGPWPGTFAGPLVSEDDATLAEIPDGGEISY